MLFYPAVSVISAAICKTSGIDYVYANELEIRDGVLTGGLIGEIVDGQGARLLREIGWSRFSAQVIAVRRSQ